MTNRQSMSGRCRPHRNRWSVKAADALASTLIHVGGVGTILAVSAVFVFLAWVAAPLFQSATITGVQSYSATWLAAQPLRIGIDEYQLLAWTLDAQGKLQVFRLDTGEKIADDPICEAGARITAACCAISGSSAALGREDGTVHLGKIGFRTTFPQPGELPEKLGALKSGEQQVHQGGILQRTPQGEIRLQRVAVELEPGIEVATSPILQIDYVVGINGPVFAALTADGQLLVSTVRQRENLLTGEITQTANKSVLPLPLRNGAQPQFLLLAGQGDSVYVAWDDGHLVRFDARNASQPVVVEQLDLVKPPSTKLTALELLLGRSTLLAGDSTGMTTAWFRIHDEEQGTADGTRLVAAHQLPGPGAAVTSLATSARSRMMAAGYANGDVRVFHVTTLKQLAEQHVGLGEAVSRVIISPKDDGLVALAGSRVWRCRFDVGHPEAPLGALFGPVWYEGYPHPEHVWQSGGGTEDLEPKFGLWPLVFGTLKATFYSMLFGAPLALLAALYTSEFLSTRVRSKVKPTIELMASLPSVVLGFLAALVLAPLVQEAVPAVLAMFVTVPLTVLSGAYIWQLLPVRLVLRFKNQRLLYMILALPLGIVAALLLGPVVERLLFGGNVMAWLDGQGGSGIGGWLILFLPLSALATALLIGTMLNPWLRSASLDWTRGQHARAELLKFLAGTIFSAALALAMSVALTQMGFDPRGTYLDTYDQRNALVVGFVMGFAIIPIIYTIADDALSSVPQHLRFASLGAGATPWQTAVRVVIPTAVSGLFAALMIGLGRAVGETMIVLMAAGNVPVRDWNLFNGFRTLSANIAVELPEAARDSTHYRTLFLAALTLFMLTFAVNTLAEVVRLRFRRRAHQL